MPKRKLSERESSEFTFKIVLIGDACTGKSTAFNVLSGVNINKQYNATLNFQIKQIEYKTNNPNVNIKIHLWDTAGQENTIGGGVTRDIYLKGADIVILFYDVNVTQTKSNVVQWLHKIKCLCNKNTHIIIFGNKIDLKCNNNYNNYNHIQKLSTINNVSDDIVVGSVTSNFLLKLCNTIFNKRVEVVCNPLQHLLSNAIFNLCKYHIV